MTPNEMPADVRHAFLELIYHTFIRIRARGDSDLSWALADHAHNIPHLIDRYSPDHFRDYWERQRPYFIRVMDQLGQPYEWVQDYWVVLGRHYQELQGAS